MFITRREDFAVRTDVSDGAQKSEYRAGPFHAFADLTDDLAEWFDKAGLVSKIETMLSAESGGDLPKTGDSSQLLLWAAMLAFAGTGAAYMRKRHEA